MDFFFYSPPNFKTATPTSRTQLKQQLMREKLQEEQRREAAVEAAAAAAAAASEALNVPTPPVPLHHALQGIDLPQQVLQVIITFPRM